MSAIKSCAAGIARVVAGGAVAGVLLGAAARWAAGDGGSYVSIESRGDVAEYYRTKGAAFAGRSIHIHLPRSVFTKPAATEGLARGSLLEFSDKGIPVLVRRDNPYFERMQRQKERGSGPRVCVKGRVETRSIAKGVSKAVLVVETVGKAGEGHPGSGRKKPAKNKGDG